MKKIIIIGGKGKVGTYLVPMLVTAGFDVTNISRGESKPFVENACWDAVSQVSLDTADPGFAKKIASLKPDIVIDMIAFNSAKDLVPLMDALTGQVEHFLVCGSVWAHGSSTSPPLDEEDDLTPFGEYGIEKCRFIREVQKRWALSRFPGTVVHPGHIVGPGHPPINPQGNLNVAVFSALMHGEKVLLPNLGMETLHHVHAKDVAGVFFASIRAGSVSYGQHFHAVSPGALTLRGYAHEAAKWFGKEATLGFLPFDEWEKTVSKEDADLTYNHIIRSHSCSMERAKRLLGFTPGYSSLDAIRESVFDLINKGSLK